MREARKVPRRGPGNHFCRPQSQCDGDERAEQDRDQTAKIGLPILALGSHPEIEKRAGEGNATEQMVVHGALDAVVEKGMSAKEFGERGGDVEIELRGCWCSRHGQTTGK